jgi:hypothetical protein
MKDNTSLKFPPGEFSHTDLAEFNGKTNQQVWQRYAEARKTGQIIPATPPERRNAGKGKPTLVWIVNPNYVPVITATPVVTVTPAVAVVVPVVDPAVKAAAKAAKVAAKVTEKTAKVAAKAVAKATKAAAKAAAKAAVVPTEPVVVSAVTPPAPVVMVTEPIEIVSVPADSVPAVVLPQTEPAVPPVVKPVVEQSITVEVIKVEPVEVKSTVANARTLTQVCPVCKNPLLAIDDATGIQVWCNQPKEICDVAENPSGHGNTEKNAYEILCEKWKFAMTGGRGLAKV